MLSSSKLRGSNGIKRALLYQLSYELVQGRYFQTITEGVFPPHAHESEIAPRN
jgi:hypothetical protein